VNSASAARRVSRSRLAATRRGRRATPKVQTDRRGSHAARGGARASGCGQTGPRFPASDPIIHAGGFDAISGCAIVCDGPKRLQAPLSAKSPLQAALRANTFVPANRPRCRDFFERSGAGVEPTQPGAARPHRF
jgi:hypothetical protein